jgi:hypothetical protein
MAELAKDDNERSIVGGRGVLVYCKQLISGQEEGNAGTTCGKMSRPASHTSMWPRSRVTTGADVKSAP